MLLSPETGEAIPFPAIEIVMRRSEELQSVVDTLRSVGAEEADIPLAEPVISGVVTLLGLDEGGHFSDLSANSLSRMRLTPELARTGALARLRQSVTHLQIDGGGGRFRVSYPDNPDLTASFMLIADGWLSGDSVAGDPVFAAGNRVSLHVCGSEDTEALAGLREIAATFYRDSVADPGARASPDSEPSHGARWCRGRVRRPESGLGEGSLRSSAPSESLTWQDRRCDDEPCPPLFL